ncbi:MAG: sigma 54-interacting transcriptional regulator [Gemmatimonadota bacterium]
MGVKQSVSERSEDPGEGGGGHAGDAPDPRALESLGALAHLAYFQVDEHRNLVALSPALEELTGFRAEDVLGRSCLTVIRCSECRQGCGVFRHHEVVDAPITLSRADGTTVDVLKSGRVFLDEQGEIRGALEVVTPSEGLPAGGRISAAAIDALFSSLGRAFFTTDGAFRVVGYSSAFDEILSLAKGTLTGVPLGRLLGEELFGEHSRFREALERGERREGVRATLRWPGRQPRQVSLSVGTIEQSDRCAGLSGRYLVMIRPERTVGELPAYRGMVSRSAAMQRIFRVIELLKDNDSTVLITGESGTGKELVARALHETSHRADKPLVIVNCAAIPSELLESELFGHVRGAFTGAVRDRAGRFETADGGTLFLDEIGDLALPLQAKLLRFLQQQTFERVGENRTRKVDVRVLAATHVNLVRAVAERRFREDLYYRLRVVPIEIPPLRDRREDLDALIRFFLDRIGQERGRALQLAPSAMRVLGEYPWPGNVRELEHALEYATMVCEGQTIHVRDLPPEIAKGLDAEVEGPSPVSTPTRDRTARPPAAEDGFAGPPADVLLSPSEAAEARTIREALERARFRKAEAAEQLGMSRTTLWRKMRRFGL